MAQRFPASRTALKIKRIFCHRNVNDISSQENLKSSSQVSRAIKWHAWFTNLNVTAIDFTIWNKVLHFKIRPYLQLLSQSARAEELCPLRSDFPVAADACHAWDGGVSVRATDGPTGLGQKVIPRLRECCRHSQAEVVSKSSNKIHQTWGPPFSRAL